MGWLIYWNRLLSPRKFRQCKVININAQLEEKLSCDKLPNLWLRTQLKFIVFSLPYQERVENVRIGVEASLFGDKRASIIYGDHISFGASSPGESRGQLSLRRPSVASSQSGSQGPVYAVPTMTLSRRPTISGPRNPQSTANQGPLYAVSSPITAGSTFNAPTEPLPAIPDDAAPPSSPPAAHPVRAPPPPPVPAGPPPASEWANPYAQIAAGGGQGEGKTLIWSQWTRARRAIEAQSTTKSRARTKLESEIRVWAFLSVFLSVLPKKIFLHVHAKNLAIFSSYISS